MTMPEMQKAISNLRLLLASIKGKEEELDNLRRQFQRQLERAPTHAIHGGNPLEATLGIMAEIQERLDNVEMMRKHLASIKKRAQDELQALDLTDKIEQAKAKVAALKGRLSNGGANSEELRVEIEELERFIEAASLQAGQAITGDFNSKKSQ